jgi:hypothetical protein
MIQISIKKQGIITNQASFETQELANAWLAQEEANQSFGKLDRWVKEYRLDDQEKLDNPTTRKVIDIEAVPAKEAVLDEEGNVLEEAVEEVKEKSHLEHLILKKYQVIIEDKTEEENQKKDKLIQKQNKRIQRIENLKSLDWSQVKTIADLKPILKTLVDDLLKDEE